MGFNEFLVFHLKLLAPLWWSENKNSSTQIFESFAMIRAGTTKKTQPAAAAAPLRFHPYKKNSEKAEEEVLSRKCSGRNGKVLEGDRQTPEDNKVNKVENNLMEQKLLPWENQYNQ